MQSPKNGMRSLGKLPQTHSPLRTILPPLTQHSSHTSCQPFSKSITQFIHLLTGFQPHTDANQSNFTKTPANKTQIESPEELSLSSDETSALRAMADELKITMNTIVQGAWAIILSFYSLEGDVVFGVIKGGRPENLPGSQEMVGLFLNTLPLRVQVDPDAELIPWLRQIRTQWNALVRARTHAPSENPSVE